MLKRKFRVFFLLAVSAAMILSAGGNAFAAVSCLGPAGSYAEEAAAKYFGEKESFLPFDTAAETLKQVLNSTAVYAVVPVESAMGGPIYQNIDLVREEYNFIVAGEIILTQRPALLVAPRTKISDIKTVLGTAADLARNEFRLKAVLPDAQPVETASAAEGAKAVAAGDKSLAVFAPSRMASAYNLDVVFEDDRQSFNDTARFWVVTTKNRISQKGDKASLIVDGDIQKLPRLLAEFDRQSLKVTALHSRPAKSKLGQYTFLIEIVTKEIPKNNKSNDTLLLNLANVAERQKGSFSIRILGIYDRAVLES